ncbi:MAG: T9SS type A sorting domain-containing protein [Bacteroidetes bacterium]|nr:T9SS type A sorting domain-containing protein [Bacteroidota bacterium]MCL5738396.1 T9SS type A sorting domain-containing protein [Bacteroidota bacterium]
MRRNAYCIPFALVFFLSVSSSFAQWQTTCQPNAVNSVVANGSVLYVNNDGTNVWMSQDSGKTWVAILNDTQVGSVSITTLLVNSGTIFVGTQGSGVYRSTDNGRDWALADSGMPASTYNVVTTFYALGDTVFVATTSLGVFRTVDGGLQWTKADSGLPNVTLNQVSAFASIGSTLFAASTNGYPNIGIFESTDYGKYWSSVLNESESAMNVGDLSSSGGNLLLSLENTTNYRYYLLISTNGGTSWEPDSIGISSFPAGVPINAFASYGSEVFAGTATSGIFRSTDDGIHWAQTNSGLLGYNSSGVNSIAFFGTDVFSECEGGNLFLSIDNGNDWRLITNGLPGDTLSNGLPGDTLSNNVTIDFEESVHSFAAKGSELFAGISGDGVYVSSDAGITWSEANRGLPYPSDGDAITIVGDSSLVAGIGGSFVPGTIYRSTDDGASWTNVNNGISVNTGINQLASIGSSVFAAASSGGYLSTDGGVNWTLISGSGGFPASTTISAAFAQGSTFFAGGSSTGILRSTNGGTQWAAANNGIPANITVSSIGGDGTNVFAVTTSGLYKSKDDGITWARSDSGLPASISVVNGYVSGQQGDIALVATAGSFTLGNVFLSTDGGTSWSSINDGMLPTSISSVFIDSGKVFVGAGNGSGGGPWGIWYWQLPAVTSVKEHFVAGKPTDFQLDQNYPNPFNPTTVISYQLSAVSNVTLRVYNVLGQEVTTLVNERQNPGSYTVTFNASNLPSGVYFYRLRAGSYVSVKKLVVLK